MSDSTAAHCRLMLKRETVHSNSKAVLQDSTFQSADSVAPFCEGDILVTDILIVNVWHMVGWQFTLKSWLIRRHIQKALCHWRLSRVKMISCNTGIIPLQMLPSTAQVHVTILAAVVLVVVFLVSIHLYHNTHFYILCCCRIWSKTSSIFTFTLPICG